MAEHALGNVSPASTATALRATNNQGTPSANYPCQALQFQALATNTASVYICDRETPNLTLNVHVEIPAPSAASPSTRPAWTIGNPMAPNSFDASRFWILPVVSGEGVRVTVIRS